MFKIISILLFGCASLAVAVTLFGGEPSKENAILSDLSKKTRNSAEDCQISYTYLGKAGSSKAWGEIPLRGKNNSLEDVSYYCGENVLFFRKAIIILFRSAEGRRRAWHQLDQVEQMSERFYIVRLNRSYSLAPYFSSFACLDEPSLSRQNYSCNTDRSSVFFEVMPHGQNEQICNEVASIIVGENQVLLFGPWKNCGLLTSSDNHLFAKKVELIERILK